MQLQNLNVSNNLNETQSIRGEVSFEKNGVISHIITESKAKYVTRCTKTGNLSADEKVSI